MPGGKSGVILVLKSELKRNPGSLCRKKKNAGRAREEKRGSLGAMESPCGSKKRPRPLMEGSAGGKKERRDLKHTTEEGDIMEIETSFPENKTEASACLRKTLIREASRRYGVRPQGAIAAFHSSSGKLAFRDREGRDHLPTPATGEAGNTLLLKSGGVIAAQKKKPVEREKSKSKDLWGNCILWILGEGGSPGQYSFQERGMEMAAPQMPLKKKYRDYCTAEGEGETLFSCIFRHKGSHERKRPAFC